MPKRERKISFKPPIEKRDPRKWLTPVGEVRIRSDCRSSEIHFGEESQTFEDVIYEVRNGVAWIIFDRPDQMNVFRCTPPAATLGSVAAAKT
jgi:hypothetical protein